MMTSGDMNRRVSIVERERDGKGYFSCIRREKMIECSQSSSFSRFGRRIPREEKETERSTVDECMKYVYSEKSI